MHKNCIKNKFNKSNINIFNIYFDMYFVKKMFNH